jgi:hypothetical protein
MKRRAGRLITAAAPMSLCLLSGLAVAAVSAPTDSFVSYFGTASAPHASTLLYGERHVLRYHDGQLSERVVLYTCNDGSAFARKTVSYVDPLAPDFLLEDATNGLRQGIRSEARGRSVFFRADRADPEQSGPLAGVPELVADTGFDEFVRANWLRLMNGQPLQIRFLVPSRLKDYAFLAQHLRSEPLEGEPAEVFRLRLSGISGWFRGSIEVSYSAAEHVLLRYEGLSDLRDAAGDNFQTQIDFPLSARKPSSEQAMRDARDTALEPCR